MVEGQVREEAVLANDRLRTLLEFRERLPVATIAAAARSMSATVISRGWR